MSDISITITSDPTQAVTDINKVKKAADDLATTSKKVAESSAADNTQAINQVLTVSRQAQQAVSQTGTAVGAVSTGIKEAGNQASRVSGALGAAIPVVGRLGSAISTALTGPVGMISAAIGVAVAQINKMIEQTRSHIASLRASAGTQVSTAYDRLMQGRQDYAAQLQVLDQIRQLDAAARDVGLDRQGVSTLKGLASQIGISDRFVSASGVDSTELADAAKRMARERGRTAAREYDDYLESLNHQLHLALKDSAISDQAKKRLSSMSVFDAAREITSAAQHGVGSTMESYKSWQDLYAIVKPLEEVRASYNRDSLLGRSRVDLNAEGFAGAKAAADARVAEREAEARAAAERTKAIEAERAEIERGIKPRESEEQRRSDAAARLTESMDREIAVQRLVNDGREREAFALRQAWAMRDARGRDLTAAELESVRSSAYTLYDLRHQQDPAAAAEAGGIEGPARARRASQQYAVPLDRLQRIGANITNPAVSRDSLTLDRQLAAQEAIKSAVQQIASASPASSAAMRFA